jgi:hypothetical protein
MTNRSPLAIIIALLLAFAFLILSISADAQPPARRVTRACFRSDAKELCCPTACIVRERRTVADGDASLAICWSQLNCSGTPPSVFALCDCRK